MADNVAVIWSLKQGFLTLKHLVLTKRLYIPAFSLLGGCGESLPPAENLLIPPPEKIPPGESPQQILSFQRNQNQSQNHFIWEI